MTIISQRGKAQQAANADQCDAEKIALDHLSYCRVPRQADGLLMGIGGMALRRGLADLPIFCFGRTSELHEQ